MERRIRLITGLVLYVYVTTHLLNHSLGIVSLQMMDDGRDVFLGLWRNWVGTAILYGSLIGHILLVLKALYLRRKLAMPIGEAVQLIVGLVLPPLLAAHIVGTRGAHELAGVEDSYATVLLIHWKVARENLLLQTAALVGAWIHGSIGMHYWLRLKPWYARWLPVFYAFALLLPVLALLGYYVAGREVLVLAQEADWARQALRDFNAIDRPTFELLTSIISMIQFGTPGLVMIVLAARFVRGRIEQTRHYVRITYPGGRIVSVAPGTSILDASRLEGIPHASVCGGRGRCSTCRVRITRGADRLPPPSGEELRVLDRIGSPLNVRLACQTKPSGDTELIPLLPPNATARDGFPRSKQMLGQEKEIAILFADLRSFTQFAEKRLPYDVVFVLNRYFANMGQAVEGAGGHLDKFIGDGVMALFGINSPPEQACREALDAARAMGIKLKELNDSLAPDLPEPLRIGIGIHMGPAIIGEMGYGPATHLTAIGDAVNTASRLESMTKDFKAQLVVSEDVANRAGVDLSAFPQEEIAVRGRAEPVRIRIIADTMSLNFGPRSGT